MQTDQSIPDFSVSFEKTHQFLRLIDARWRASLETSPDFIVFLPPTSTGPFAENQHFLVAPISTNRFFAVWTTASREGTPDQRIVYSISSDLGVTWSFPKTLAGDIYGTKHRASWAFPIVVPGSRRIYVFWNAYTGVSDAREDTTGLMGFKYSDDLGVTWSAENVLEVPKGQISSRDSRVPENWIVWQTPLSINDDEAVVGYTRWASSEVNPSEDLFQRISEVSFMKIEGLAGSVSPLPKISIYPSNGIGLRVRPNSGMGISVAQEPSIVRLSDGSFFCVARTLNGSVYWSRSRGTDISSDWLQLTPLLFEDGTPVRQPIASAPIYKLGSSNYFLLFHNNSGNANGGVSPSDYLKNRRPAFVSFVSESLDREQPVRVARPSFRFDNSGFGDGASARTEVATYPSFFSADGVGYLWYPDRKHYLLGKRFEINYGRLIPTTRSASVEVGERAFSSRGSVSEVGGARFVVVSEPSVYLGAAVNIVVRVIDDNGWVDQGAIGKITILNSKTKSKILEASLTVTDRGVKYLKYKPTEAGITDLEFRFLEGNREDVTVHRFEVAASVEYSIPDEVRVLDPDELLRIDSHFVSVFSNRLQWVLAKQIAITNSEFEFVNTNSSMPVFLGWRNLVSSGSAVIVETNSPLEGAKSIGFRLDSSGSYVGVSTRALDVGTTYRVELSAKSDLPDGCGIQIFGVFDKHLNFPLGSEIGSYHGFGVSTNSNLTISRSFGSTPNSKIVFDRLKLEQLHMPVNYTNSFLEIHGRELRDFDQIYLHTSNIVGDQYIGPIRIVR